MRSGRGSGAAMMLQRSRPDEGELSAPPLLLRCLGSLRLFDGGGNDLTPRTRKARALLAFLALNGRSTARARLADLLWSDRGEEQAKSSLRQALFELRHLDEAGVLSGIGRDDIELSQQRVTTDLALITDAARRDDHQTLATMLLAAEPGLLTDLDGLDPEFDAWLRIERGSQLSQTLAVALESATRLHAASAIRPAKVIVAEIVRLDPCSEEAARLAMLIDHQLGDTASLHRRFELLREHLREDCGAEPSLETRGLFADLCRKVDIGEDAVQPVSVEPNAAGNVNQSRATMRRFGKAALAGPALVAIGLVAATWWMNKQPTTQAGPPLLAVLPLSQQHANEDFLAQGIWEDTRVALSQHGNLRVLGQVTTKALASANASPRDYRDKLGVDYVLEGNVRQDGNQVRVTVGLIRTSDGISIWNTTLRARLGDPVALQGAIAQGIEGQLRGRLAPGGGRMPDQIATTGEVYGLYSHARALLRERNADQARNAGELLRRATALDPNYAPAWVSLAAATYFAKYGPEGRAAKLAEARSHIRRALTLAPNLAEAHSTIALIAGVGSPEGEQALKRAIQLDPNNAEAWNWLANTQARQYKRRAAVTLYQKALAIDPLWLPAAANLAANASALGDKAAVDRAISGFVRAGGKQEDILALRSAAPCYEGDISAALAPLLALRSKLPSGEFSSSEGEVGGMLLRLGYADETSRLWGHPDWFAPVLRSEVVPPEMIAGQTVGARDFWTTYFFPVFTSRAMLNLGKASDLVAKYRKGFRSRDEFVVAMDANDILGPVAPNVAVALQQVGQAVEAGRLLSATENQIRGFLANAPGDRELLWNMARIRAAQGRSDASIVLIRQARTKGFLPDGIWHPIDIAQEPTFRLLRGDPRFELARRQILAHVAKERAELGTVRI